ncbi:metallophosphoesterase family protein [Lactobacillus sp.]|uniref:metallophosphoesterase family protein n=1 Tax=Lactobacillus sp. TaxID=1591 RepID=UPI003EF4BD8F
MKVITDKVSPEFWLLSDPHLIADSLHDFGPRFEQMRATSAGKDIAYQETALMAFVRKVVKEKPDAVVITGDLTFNGAKASAKKFAEHLAPLKDAGVALIAIPGNHDIFDGWARRFEADKEYRVDQISPSDWREIFSATYDLAASTDPNSLSFAVNLNPHWRLLCLDSNIYGHQESYGHPITSGNMTDSERAWLTQELETGQQAGQEMLFFMHHNLYDHNSVVHDGFKLNNAAELLALLKKYPVRCAFSGHIHAQHIMAKQVAIPEIVSSCFAETDQGYGIVKLDNKQLDYQRYSFDIDNYLTEQEKKAYPFNNFHSYLEKVFDGANDQLMDHFLTFDGTEEGQEAVALLKKLHWNFFTGQGNLTPAELAALKKSAPYQKLIQMGPNLRWYLNSLTESQESSQELTLSW